MWQIDLYDKTILDNNLLEQVIHVVVDITIIIYGNTMLSYCR